MNILRTLERAHIVERFSFPGSGRDMAQPLRRWIIRTTIDGSVATLVEDDGG